MCMSVVAIPSIEEVLDIETSPSENLLDVGNNTEYSEEDEYYNANMRKLYEYLDTIRDIARPGCSSEVLDVALESISQMIDNLSLSSSYSRHHA